MYAHVTLAGVEMIALEIKLTCNTLTKPIYLALGKEVEKVPILAQPFLSISIMFSVIWIVVAVPALATSIHTATLPTDYGGIQALWVSGREKFPLTCQ